MAEVCCPWLPLDGVTPGDEVVADVLRAYTPPGVNTHAARAGCWLDKNQNWPHRLSSQGEKHRPLGQAGEEGGCDGNDQVGSLSLSL